MINQKNYLIVICLLISLFSLKAYSQIKKSNNELWIDFKNSAHKIGFCIYHVKQEVCKEHLLIKNELKKVSKPESDSDIYYFLLNPKWAKKRLIDYSENNDSKPEDFLILFDIDQNSFKKLYDSTKTSNSYKMFSILNLNDKFEFKTHRETNSNIIFYISSSRTNSILSNTMWREFMSNRLGRLDSKIEISITGVNALNDYRYFKNSFLTFIEK